MTVVCGTLLGTHLHVLQPFLGLGKAGRRRIILDIAVFQIVQPLLQRRTGYLIELIDADDIVFWENIGWSYHLDGILVAGVND